ncbi:hypothetical protein [Mucilaginibacter sp. UYCu711]|uniref:hypothetical protein n=1 Tax=Mucilaginibacter sp. UYCu711 TaxID=3156339 RepID=UPI003D23D63B
MNTNFIFNQGFTFSKNPLDKWNYLADCSWSEDYRLLTKLFAFDNEALTRVLASNDKLKTYELFLIFDNNPGLGSIILEHYSLPYDHDTFSNFIKFLWNHVDVIMNDIADCVYLNVDQTPFDHLPFQSLMEEYLHISHDDLSFCRLLIPINEKPLVVK